LNRVAQRPAHAGDASLGDSADKVTFQARTIRQTQTRSEIMWRLHHRDRRSSQARPTTRMAFTLVELLVVIAIIGVLIGL
jgi:prepilin-type N-terminal cleavage/methylation domain-containing protein